jgi:hypothetical protein
MTERAPAALTAAAVAIVVDAAAKSRTVIVEHGLAAAAVGDDAELEGIAARRPEGWLRTVDGDVETATGRPVALLDPMLPHQHRAPTVTRMFHLQRSSELQHLPNGFYAPLEAAWPADEPWLERDASMLVSSQGGVTPAHADRHHNLLVQVSGSKQLGVAVPGSREHAATVARSCPSLRVATMPSEAKVIELHAGQALYLPPYTIHWVRSTERSIALTCGWSSAETLRMGEVLAANATLLRLGIPARPYGSRGEAAAMRAASLARRLRNAGRGRVSARS